MKKVIDTSKLRTGHQGESSEWEAGIAEERLMGERLGSSSKLEPCGPAALPPPRGSAFMTGRRDSVLYFMNVSSIPY